MMRLLALALLAGLVSAKSVYDVILTAIDRFGPKYSECDVTAHYGESVRTQLLTVATSSIWNGHDENLGCAIMCMSRKLGLVGVAGGTAGKPVMREDTLHALLRDAGADAATTEGIVRLCQKCRDVVEKMPSPNECVNALDFAKCLRAEVLQHNWNKLNLRSGIPHFDEVASDEHEDYGQNEYDMGPLYRRLFKRDINSTKNITKTSNETDLGKQEHENDKSRNITLGSEADGNYTSQQHKVTKQKSLNKTHSLSTVEAARIRRHTDIEKENYKHFYEAQLTRGNAAIINNVATYT